MTIIAENGAVKIGGQYMDKVEVCNVKDYVMPELAPTNQIMIMVLIKVLLPIIIILLRMLLM
jgi:hypothetical protein